MEDSTPSTGHAQYRAMTPAQKAAWGRAELETRKRDLVDHGFDAADTAADSRRLAIGASHRAATSMVGQAARQARKQEAQRRRDVRTEPPAFTAAQISDLARLGRVAVACEQQAKGRAYDRALQDQQQYLAATGRLEGWK